MRAADKLNKLKRIKLKVCTLKQPILRKRICLKIFAYVRVLIAKLFLKKSKEF